MGVDRRHEVSGLETAGNATVAFSSSSSSWLPGLDIVDRLCGVTLTAAMSSAGCSDSSSLRYEPLTSRVFTLFAAG